jgi:hypothetical protein
MRGQSIIEMMGAYASATGLPPTGTHRRLTDQLIMRMGVRCGTCRGDGVLTSIEDRTSCSKCHRFGWRLTAAEVRRIHQIVTARFPELRNTDGRLERAVSLWGSKRRRAMDGPIYLGIETPTPRLPASPNAGRSMSHRLSGATACRANTYGLASCPASPCCGNLCVICAIGGGTGQKCSRGRLPTRRAPLARPAACSCAPGPRMARPTNGSQRRH